MTWRPPVPPLKRARVSLKRALAILSEQGGICPCCDAPISMGQLFEVDHWNALELGGSNDRDNLRAIHKSPCHRRKTAADRRLIAKLHRIQKREAGERKPSRLRGRGFGQAAFMAGAR